MGKSSILNILSGEDAETGEVSRINRGKHTTRHVELFQIDEDTFILDTPGFSSLALSDICDVRAAELADYYPEFKSCADECRFKGCSHINEPDCAVKKAVADKKAALAENRFLMHRDFSARTRRPPFLSSDRAARPRLKRACPWKIDRAWKIVAPKYRDERDCRILLR